MKTNSLFFVIAFFMLFCCGESFSEDLPSIQVLDYSYRSELSKSLPLSLRWRNPERRLDGADGLKRKLSTQGCRLQDDNAEFQVKCEANSLDSSTQLIKTPSSTTYSTAYTLNMVVTVKNLIKHNEVEIPIIVRERVRSASQKAVISDEILKFMINSATNEVSHAVSDFMQTETARNK
ncbi:MAG: hypothetical protein IKP00_17885 [Victivallales bacterium]|nr:hypothetical protein [Victivallales bacterium]